MATTDQIEKIVKLFIGYFDRAPAPNGTNYWAGRLEAGMTWAKIAESFSVQSETTALYPIMITRDFSKASIETFLNDVFQNLFGRDIKENGLTYYSEQLANGRTIGEIILDIINGAVSGPDKARIDNKVAVSSDFFNKTDAIPDFNFDDAARTVATDLLKGVTSDPSTVPAAIAKADTYIDTVTGGGSSGTTINLTSDTDQPGGGGNGADTQGTSGDDTYSATVEANGGGTLQSSDNIAAGAGTDTLNVRVISTTTGGQLISPAGSDLEKVVVTNQTASGIFILDLNSVTGVTEVTAKDNAASALTGFGNLDIGTMIRAENVDGIVGVNFKGDRSASSNDSFDLFTQDSGTEDRSMVFVTSDAQVSSTDTDFEVANIETGGTSASFLNLLGLELETLNVTGSQQLNVEDSSDGFEDLKSVDASGMTGGGINVNAQANTQSNFAFIGSAQDDSIELNRSLFSNANTLSLDGGDGIDTLTIESFTNQATAPAVNAAVSNFEILQATDAVSSLKANDYTKIDTFSFAGQTGNDSRLNITGVTSDDKFVFKSDVGNGDEAVRFAADTAGQSLTFELEANSGSGGEIRIISDTNANNGSAAVGFGNTNISSVEIISSGSNTNANVIRAVDNNNDNYFAFDNQNGPSNFTISGSQALTITAEAGVNLDASSDERGFESGVNLDGSDATGNLRIAGSGSNDTIETGAGKDIIYGLGGDNVLTGNADSDQFRFSNFNGTDTIKDFVAGEDKVGLERVDFNNTTASSEGTALNTSDYVQNLQAVASLSNADSDKLVELQLGATNDQITQTTIAATNTYLLAFNQTSGKGELWFDADWSTASSRTMTASFENITELADLIGLTNTDFVEYTF